MPVGIPSSGSTRVQELLKSNEPPFQQEQTTMQNHLADIRRVQQCGLEERIQAMRDATAVLQLQLEQVSEAAKIYQTLLHPVRTLPTDILREILLAASGMDQTAEVRKLAKTRDAISQVCQEWRRTSFSYPRLWSTIAIDFDVVYRTRGPTLSLARQILHSANALLLVWLEWTGEPRTEALALILVTSVRWKSLVVVTDSWEDDVLYPIRGSLPLLENLCLSGCGQESGSVQTASSTFQFPPLLRCLEISTDKKTFQKWQLPWSQIRKFTNADVGKAFPPILPFMVNRVSCRLSVSGEEFAAVAPLKLSHLTELHIHVLTPVDLTQLINALLSPSLQKSIFSSLRCPGSILGDPRCILEFVQRSRPPLTTLVIYGNVMSLPSDVLEPFLEVVPTLQHLKIPANGRI
ncbi:hypothetical protein C8J56DRAFT_920739 [Mycena floridula]|nr:hypothetical protein C8J56DRAFT_920739 [Mycena floridula]